MDEIEAFNNLLRRNPTPGDKNIIIRKETVCIDHAMSFSGVLRHRNRYIEIDT